ncbi:MAG: hypothetical protein ACYC4L_18450 [Chloroflexota bacterium]
MSYRFDTTLPRSVLAWGPRLWATLLGAVVRNQPRSLGEDAALLLAKLQPPPLVEGRENIPARQAFVLVGNHHQPPRIWVGMLVAAISRVVAEARPPGAGDLHWLALANWRWFQWRGHGVPHPLTTLVFGRVLRVWGAVPTPSDPADVAGRARALRQVLGYLGRKRRAAGAAPQPVAMFPEGTGTIALAEAQPGSGAFLQRLSSHGFPLLPVASFWQAAEGRLHIRFGRPFYVGAPPPGCALSLDDWARRRVMGRIGTLLPRELWGVYAEAVAEELAAGE